MGTIANLYHYTTQDGRDGILREKFINANDGRYGRGVYFTKSKPRNADDNIFQGIYDGGFMGALDRWENLSYVITISKEVHF